MTHTQIHRSKWQRTALVLLLGSMVQTAFAAVISVSAQDNLNDALARAQAGDTLKLASGTYKTKLYIDKPITMKVRPTALPRLSATGADVPLPFMRLT